MLSSPDEYRGGGTFFRCMRRTLKLDKGQVLIHAGDLFHSGVPITEGTRQYVDNRVAVKRHPQFTNACRFILALARLVIGFMDGFHPGIVDRSPASDDFEGYQQQILQFHA